MKKIHIAAVCMIVVAIALLVNSTSDYTSYASFQDARESAKTVKIAGQLAKDKVLQYDPAVDPNYFAFFVKDAQGEERKVILHAAKPKDFEMSEQIVITGKMNGEEFVASDVLLKCPSKYKDEEIYIKSEKSI